MADFADLASDLTDLQIEEALDKQREKARIERSRMPFIGCCYNCEEPVGAQAHFCDADCREDWVKRSYQERQKSDPASFMLEFDDQ
jgi:hypothetical protein